MYTYEVWLEGNCLRNGENYEYEFDTEVEAMDEAENEVYCLLEDEGYAEDGYEFDDFEIITKRF